jgi:transketolase
MNSEERVELERLALTVREHVLRMSGGGGCFLGASLSCADVLVHLYTRVLRRSGPRDPSRDYVLLSKGHDVPALYATLAELGYFPKERLEHHLSIDDHLYWHPNTAIPGVEFHSGSLGHLLSVGIGIAYDAKRRGDPNRVFVLLGDGELDEGSIWEGLLVASALRLDNLVCIVDRNGFQANVATEELLPLEPLAQKLESFGAAVIEVDGHDFGALDRAYGRLPVSNRPVAIVARTRRGKGIPSIENRADRWFCKFTGDQIAALMRELHTQERGELVAETLTVR